MCYYLDSLPAYDRPPPYHLVDRIRSLANATHARLAQLPVKLQTNTYDCGTCQNPFAFFPTFSSVAHHQVVVSGAYVCIYAEVMLNYFLQGLDVAKVSEHSKSLTQEKVDIKRQDIGRLVCRLFDEKHKAASTSS